MSEAVLFKVEAAVAWATLNRPQVLNAINPEMIERLIEIVRNVGADDNVRVLVISGNGRAFSAGADIKAMHAMNELSFAAFIDLLSGLSEAIHNLAKPVIAAVNGYALAGGFELALICDVRIAAESAVFGLPDTPLGLPPTSGMTYLLPRVVGLGRAIHLVLSGDQIDARKAEQIGLVTEVVQDQDLSRVTQTLAEKLASFPALAVALSKQCVYAGCDSELAAALVTEKRNEIACFRTEETANRIAAFVRSRVKI